MRRTMGAIVALLTCLALLGTAAAVQAQGRGNNGGGPPTGTPGGGPPADRPGGGRPGEPPGQGQAGGGPANAVLFGDLYVIERDGNGIPITVTFTLEGENGTTTETCVQPIAADCTILPLKGADPNFDPEVDDACDVQDAVVDQLQPVSFGRQSVARAPAAVLDQAYFEALANFNAAAVSGDPTPYALDAAGRVVLTLLDETTEDPADLVQKTIDAPLENLGMYRKAMTIGCLGPVTIERQPGVLLSTQLTPEAKAALQAAGLGDLVCSTATNVDPVTDLDMFRAAAFYAAAADKFDPVTIDEIINVNTYLGVNTVTTQSTGRARTVVTITFFEFEPGGVPYQYDRNTTHPAAPVTVASGRVLPTLARLLTNPTTDATNFVATDVSLFAASPPGVDLEAVNVQVCRGGEPFGEALNTDSYCQSGDDTFSDEACGGANWFTQTAEDARKIVWFLHNWEVPEVAY